MYISYKIDKSDSGLFKNTIGTLKELAEQVITRYMRNGDKNVDFEKLPGSKGIQVSKRLSDREMIFLTEEYGVEFAQVYEYGPGKNGRGGKYYVYSGTINSVQVPVRKNIMLINHTHPGGTATPSQEDKELLLYFALAGSPQKTSAIIPLGKSTIKFTSKGIK
ncbi:MAG: hypothetical protein J5778_10765 [Clostridiales bacterium]|nr:hypothetical protein [Clostridiales bacterium]